MAKQTQPGKQTKSLLKLIEKYYADLADFRRQHVLFEMGTRQAFHSLLHNAGKPHGWTLIAEQEKKVNGKTIRPDGTFKDEMNLVRGYWEAKDPADKLDAEIEKKRKAGYPLNNIIFEDTQTAVQTGYTSFWHTCAQDVFQLINVIVTSRTSRFAITQTISLFRIDNSFDKQ